MIHVTGKVTGIIGAKVGASGHLGPNRVCIDGQWLNVWPRDVVAFKAAVAAGEPLPVRVTAHLFTPEGEETPVARPDLTFVSGQVGSLVEEPAQAELKGE